MSCAICQVLHSIKFLLSVFLVFAKCLAASCPTRVVWPMWAAGRVASMANADLRSCAGEGAATTTHANRVGAERRFSALWAARVVQEGRN